MSEILSKVPTLILVNPLDFTTASGTNPWIAASTENASLHPQVTLQRFSILRTAILDKANPSSNKADPLVAPRRFDGSTLPSAPSAESPPVPQIVNAGIYSECDPFAPAAENLAGVTEYYASQIIDPMGGVVDSMLAANDELKGLFVTPFKYHIDNLFKFSKGKIKNQEDEITTSLNTPGQLFANKKPDLRPPPSELASYPKPSSSVSSPQQLLGIAAGLGEPPRAGLQGAPFSSNIGETVASLSKKESIIDSAKVKADDLIASLGLPVIQNKGDAEKALRERGIYIVNGLYLKTGSLDLTAAKVMARLLGTNDPIKLEPYLGKPDGAFTFIISRIFQRSAAGTIAGCEPVALPYGTCAVPDEQIVTVEEILGIDVSINSVLSSHTDVKREELTFYVFWQTAPSFTKVIINALRLLGLTDAEFSAAFTVTELENLKPYILKEPSKVLEFTQKYFDENTPVISNGPDTVDPDPTADQLIDDIKNKTASPESTMAPGSNISDFTNVPALVVGSLNLNRTFDCRDILELLSSANVGVSAAIQGAGTAFDLANFVLQQAQNAINGVGNDIQNMLSMAEQFGQNFPGSLVQCLFAGQSATFGISLPRAALDGMNFLLNTVIDKVLGFFDLFDKLLLGMLTGLCVSTSALIGLSGLGPAASALGSNLDCANTEIPLPDFVLEGIRCLIAILQLVQDLVNRAIGFLRNLIATLQTMAFQFNLTLAKGVDTCLPPAVAASKLTIESLIKGSGVF